MLFYKGELCSANLGRQGRKNFNEQLIDGFAVGQATYISLGNRCEYPHVAIHEIMHALGFNHEQARPDRDTYIQVCLLSTSPFFIQHLVQRGKCHSLIPLQLS